MSCLVCCVDYYISGEENQSVVSSLTQSSESSNICSFICDSGKQCKLKKIEEDLCNIHCVYRTKITCPFCLADYCRICYRKYFLSSLEEPHCMNCKKGFSVEFLLGYDEHIQRFSNKFVWGPLKEHREDVLLDQIMARLPTFQLTVTEQLTKERFREKLIKIDQRIKEIQFQNIEIIRRIVIYEEYDIKNDELYKTVNRNKARLIKLEEFKNELKNPLSNIQEEKEEKEKSNKTHGNCLNKDKGCNGFINNDWKCGICFVKVCSKCHNFKENEHECNPDEVESIKALKDIAKPCPGCNQMIERTQGCNQMWCLNCHNFFDWNTLKIIKKTQYVHNPEHIAWLAKNNQTLGNIAGPAEVNVCDIGFHHITRLQIPDSAKEILNENLRLCNEIQDEIDTYRDPLEKNIEKHAVDFLKGKIDKNDLKKLVQRNYKSSKKTEFANMYRMMFIDNVKNVLVYSVNEISNLPKNEIDTLLQNTFTVLNNSREYTEKNLKLLGNLFNSEKPHLSNISVRSAFNGKKFVERFLKNLHKLRTERFYMDYSTRRLYFILTKTDNEKDLVKFLKINTNWVPTSEEILKAYQQGDVYFP